MTNEQFNFGMERLKACWGATKANAAWAELLRERVIKAPWPALDAATKQVVANHLPPQTVDQMAALISKAGPSTDQKFEMKLMAARAEGICEECDNLGWFTARRYSDGCEFAFRCNRCRSHEILGVMTGLELWNDFAARKYETHRAAVNRRRQQ